MPHFALLSGELGEMLTPYLTQEEIAATQKRVSRLILEGRFPEPSPDWPAIPWPAF